MGQASIDGSSRTPIAVRFWVVTREKGEQTRTEETSGVKRGERGMARVFLRREKIATKREKPEERKREKKKLG